MRKILRHPFLVLGISILLTILLAIPLKNIHIESSIRQFFPQDHEAYTRLNETEDQFGSMIAIGISFEAPGNTILTKEYVNAIRKITADLETVENIENVTSMTNIDYIDSVDGTINVNPLFDKDLNEDLTQKDIELVTERISNWEDMYSLVVLSKDGRATQIAMNVNQKATLDEQQTALMEVRRIAKYDILQYAPSLRDKMKFYGDPVISEESKSFLLSDLAGLIPLVVLVVLISLYFSFSTLDGTILPLITVLMSTVWSVGIMSLSGMEFSLVSSVIPVALIACGSAYGIHVLTHYYIEVDKKRHLLEAEGKWFSKEDHLECISGGLKNVGLAVLLSAVTTIAGFISLVTSPIRPLFGFAIFTAIGIAFSLILSVTVIPALLSLKKLENVGKRSKRMEKLTAKLKKRLEKTEGSKIAGNQHVGFSATLYNIFDFLCGSKPRIIVFSAVIVVLSVAGLLKLVIDTSMVNYFPETAQLRQDINYVNDNFAGTNSVYLLIRSPAADLRDEADRLFNEAMNIEEKASQTAQLKEKKAEQEALAAKIAGDFKAKKEKKLAKYVARLNEIEAEETKLIRGSKTGNPITDKKRAKIEKLEAEYDEVVKALEEKRDEQLSEAEILAIKAYTDKAEEIQAKIDEIIAEPLSEELTAKVEELRKEANAKRAEADKALNMTNPEILKSIDDMQSWIDDNFDVVGKTVSYANSVKRFNQVFNGPGSTSDMPAPSATSTAFDDAFGDFGDFSEFDDFGDFGSEEETAAEDDFIEGFVHPNVQYEKMLGKSMTAKEVQELIAKAYARAGGKRATVEQFAKTLQKEMNYAGQAYYEVPYDAEKYGKKTTASLSGVVSNYLQQLGSAMDRFTDDTSEGVPGVCRVQVQIKTNSTQVVGKMLDQFEAYADEHLPDGYYMLSTGEGEMEYVMTNLVVSSQMTSLLVSLILVFVIIAVSFKSCTAGFIGAIPLAFTIILNYMVMGFTGIKLDLITSIIASVAIGVGIDYTIHFMTEYRALRQNSDNIEEVTRGTFKSSGIGIVTNALAVGLGFLVLCLSKFVVLRYIGVLVAIVMFTSSLLAMTILPGIFNIFDPDFLHKGQPKAWETEEDSNE